MKLPQLSYPTYEVQLLSIKDPVTIRPFTVREEKLLLISAATNELGSTINTMKQVVQNCLIDDIDVNDLAMVDVEIIYMNLRARSIGETGKSYFKCKNIPEGSNTECGMVISIDIDFLNIPVVNTDREKTIKFTEDVGVILKYPTYRLFGILKDAEAVDVEYLLAANCIDKIYDKDNSYNAADCTPKELLEFITTLPTDKYHLIKEFTQHLPKTRQVSQKKCTKCGFDHTLTLEGIEDFFV